MKKILIPTDFSDNAWDALTYAIRLYDDIPCVFYILNTYETVATGVNTTVHSGATRKLNEILKEDSKKGLKKIEDHLNEHLLNEKHQYHTLSKYGSLINIVERLVFQENIDLIVMGTTGASGMKEVLMGSNAIRLIKNIKDCPIIAVPKTYEFKEPERISFATDLKKTFTADELNPLRELLLIHNLNLEIVRVKKVESLDVHQINNKQTIERHLADRNITYKEIEFEDSIATSLKNYTQTNPVDMICLTNYDHTFFERLFHEPIIKKVGFHTVIPLLIISI